MVFTASRKIDRKHKTRVSLLLLAYLAMPAASNNTSLDTTSSSLTARHCGHILLTANAQNNEIHNMSTKIRNHSASESSLPTIRRNSDIKILKRVKTQLKVAMNHFRNNREIIARLYTDVKSVMQTDYHYEWLPSRPLDWYEKHVRKLDKDRKVFILLPVLRDSLHNFSVTLEQMRQFSETHYMSNYTIRKIILDDLSKHLIAVLCEVETALVSISSWRDHRHRTPARTVVVGGPGWDPNPDHTAMLIQDWGVLTIYYRFLKEWLKISNRMVKDQLDPVDTADGTSDDGTAADPTTVTSGTTPPPPPPCIRHKCGGSSSKHRRHKSSYSVT